MCVCGKHWYNAVSIVSGRCNWWRAHLNLCMFWPRHRTKYVPQRATKLGAWLLILLLKMHSKCYVRSCFVVRTVWSVSVPVLRDVFCGKYMCIIYWSVKKNIDLKRGQGMTRATTSDVMRCISAAEKASMGCGFNPYPERVFFCVTSVCVRMWNYHTTFALTTPRHTSAGAAVNALNTWTNAVKLTRSSCIIHRIFVLLCWREYESGCAR